MKILMLGWELPPHISSGLGTACAGLLDGLGHIDDVHVTFVLPRLYGDESCGANVTLIGVSNLCSGGSPVRGAPLRLHMPENESRLLDDIHRLDDLLSTGAANRQLVPHQVAAASGPGSVPPVKSSYSYGLMREVQDYANQVVSHLAHYGEFDIIHAHDWLTYLAGIQIKELTRKALVVHVHSTEFDRSGSGINPAIYEIERNGMEAADKIVAVSGYTKHLITEKYHQDSQKIDVVYNAGPTGEDSIRPVARAHEPAVVTFIGRVTYQKGPRYFIDAAQSILRQKKNVTFVMAGDGDQLPLMKSLVKARGIADHFKFPGFLSTQAVSDLLRESDIYVMPSTSEPFGISAAEAVKAGVPVVLSTHCGISEVLKNTRVVDVTDIEALADHILELLDHPELAHEMNVAAKTELQQLTWVKSARTLHEVYSCLHDMESDVGLSLSGSPLQEKMVEI